MDISRIPPTPPEPPIGSAEENLLNLTMEMINQIEKLKEALSKEKIDPNLISNPDHINDVAKTVIALDKASSQAQRIR